MNAPNPDCCLTAAVLFTTAMSLGRDELQHLKHAVVQPSEINGVHVVIHLAPVVNVHPDALTNRRAAALLTEANATP